MLHWIGCLARTGWDSIRIESDPIDRSAHLSEPIRSVSVDASASDIPNEIARLLLVSRASARRLAGCLSANQVSVVCRERN